jgi:hypothetical protein
LRAHKQLATSQPIMFERRNRAPFEWRTLMDYDPNLEVRVARLEQAMESVQSDIREIKIDLRGFRAEFVEFKCGVKDEFTAVRIEMRDEFAAVRKEMKDEFAAVRKEMKDEFAAVRKEMKDEFAAVRKEMKDEFAAVRKEFNDKFESFRKEFDEKLEAHKKEHKADLLKAAGFLASMILGLAGMMARGFGWL